MEGEKKTVALDGKRAITWEISDSEEDGDVKPESSTASAIYSDVGVQGCSDKQELEPGMAKAVPLLIPLTQTVSCNSRPEKKKKKQSLEKNKMAQIKTEEKKKSMDKKEEKMKIKQQIAAEKERRKEAAAALKFLRPDQCMKQMIVCVDSGSMFTLCILFLSTFGLVFLVPLYQSLQFAWEDFRKKTQLVSHLRQD